MLIQLIKATSIPTVKCHLINENVCFLKMYFTLYPVIQFLPTSHLSVSYSIPAFSGFFALCIIILILYLENFIHLREIYITLLVCFSICHMYRTLLSETNVNDYAKVRNTD